jgi:hypothetical protein
MNLLLATLGLSGTYDRMLCLILDERSRELCWRVFTLGRSVQEQKHWFQEQRLLMLTLR